MKFDLIICGKKNFALFEFSDLTFSLQTQTTKQRTMLLVLLFLFLSPTFALNGTLFYFVLLLIFF